MDQKNFPCHVLSGMSKSDNNVCWNFILLFLQIAKCQGRIIWGIAMKACFVMGMQTFGRGQMNFCGYSFVSFVINVARRRFTCYVLV